MPVVDACGAEVLANDLLTALTTGVDFTLPTVDFSDILFNIPTAEVGITVSRLTNEELTTGVVNGTGTFDVLMKGLTAHLTKEFESGRITGEQYAKAHIALTEAAMGQAVQYLINRDTTYWQAITARLQAQIAQTQVISARVELESAKLKYEALRTEALTSQANFALAKMKLSVESVNYCTAQYTLENMLPTQKLMLDAQLAGQLLQNATLDYTLLNMLPTQKLMLEEQLEAARAQTLDTRRDGTTIIGLLGKQKALYSQQIISYQRDAETKVMKIFSDAWIVMKGLDEGLLPPTAFTNASLNGMLEDLKFNVSLGDPTATGATSPTVVSAVNNSDGTTTTTYSDGTATTRSTVYV